MKMNQAPEPFWRPLESSPVLPVRRPEPDLQWIHNFQPISPPDSTIPSPKSSSPGVIERPEVEESGPSTGGAWIVVVYDNSVNTYEEVIHILMLATHCTFDEAAIETWEIDHLGKSVVHHGKEDECNNVASVIARIGIKVEVKEE
ncbi:MAG: ATP-dependent Clp protease adaptor ClpS [Fimbriimonadaceae bacterium]|nr:ATP-dependent Clp protease adaptor ClpS [Fimbriimonadaceae bacterium]